MGAVLGAAAYAAETSDGKRWRWAALSPLLLALIPAIVLEGFIPRLVTTGLGSGAIMVALIGLLGGYIFSGFAARWMRLLSGLLIVGVLVFLASGAGSITPSAGVVFCALLFFLLLALLIAGVSAPSRYWFSRHASK